jgi:glycosyltransferase involved in cell wall biosynthesis
MKISDKHIQALKKMDEQDFTGAVHILEGLSEKGDWIVKNDLALCLSMLDKTDKSVSLFDEILDDDPQNIFAKINRHYIGHAQKIRKTKTPDAKKRVIYEKGTGPEFPQVSVIMPTWNRGSEIRENIESVLSQKMGDFELIVVNDGGEKDVEKTIEDYLGDGRVRYIYAEHGGTSSAINTGLSVARGEYICYLDDDDIYYDNHLEVLTEIFDTNKDAVCAHTLIYRAVQEPDEEGHKITSRELKFGPDIKWEQWRVQMQIPNRNPIMHKRRVLSEIGAFTEAIEYTEDWEFCLRLVRNYDFKGINEITGEYRIRPGSAQKTTRPKGPRNNCRNLIVFLNGIFPLCGWRFTKTRQGNVNKLEKELSLLWNLDMEWITSLELRKLILEPYYSLFYRLGKDLLQEGRGEEAKIMFKGAFRIRPFEPKLVSKVLSFK